MKARKAAWVMLAAFFAGAAAWLNIRKRNRQGRKNYKK